MATFTEYLKFEEDIYYRDKQVSEIYKVNISEDYQEILSKIGKELKMLVFAHPRCPDCIKVVSILENLKKYIPSLEIDYRQRSIDKDLLLKYSPEGRIPTIFLVDGIKITKLFSEFPENIKEEMLFDLSIRKKFHDGHYDNDIIEQIVSKIRE